MVAIGRLKGTLPVRATKVGVAGGVVSVITTVCVTLLLFPAASVKIHSMVDVPWEVITVASEVVAVTTPEQLSIAVGAATVVEHWAVMVARVGATGAIISAITTVCVALLLFPAASVKIHSMVDVPCAVITVASEVVAVTTPEQLSIAVGAVTVVEQTAVIVAKVGATGAIVSAITTVCVALLLFPAASVKIHSMVDVPCAVITVACEVVAVTTPEQLSIAVGAATVVEHWAVMVARVGATGAIISAITTVCVALLLFPAASVKIHRIVDVPWVVITVASVVVAVTTPEQLSIAVGVATVVEH